MSAPADAKTVSYRPDVDGLRGIAVMLVILFHAWPSLAAGGFVGVDVFFVISGYLITSIICRALADGTFTLAHFYSRRCRRILPALLTVLAAAWLAGRLLLNGDDFRLLAEHIIGGATFTSNVLLWRNTGYFDVEAIRKPLLHLWSLAVEEQFYVVWPPLVMIAAARRWPLHKVGAAGLACSLVLAVTLTPAHPALVFYMLPTRMWELLAGALLASGVRIGRAPFGNLGGGVAAGVGLAVIGLAAFFASGGGGWHIAWLAAAVAGTALLVAVPEAAVNRRILSHPGLVTIGLFSYPLYLWHWPLLSLTMLLYPRAGRLQTVELRMAAVAAAFLLAWATWQFIERPIRGGAADRWLDSAVRDAGVLGISAALLLIMAIGGSATLRRLPVAARPVAAGDSEPLLDADVLFKGAAWHRYSSAADVVLLVGDSHANHYLDGLLPIARAHGFGISHIGLGGCLGVPLAERLWGTSELFARCQSLAAATFPRFMRDPAVKIVVFAARGELYAEGEEAGVVVAAEHHTNIPPERRAAVLHDAYAAAIRRAADAGKRIVVTLDIPELDYDPAYCRDDHAEEAATPPCAIERSRVDERQRRYRAVVQRLRQEEPRITVFDPLPMICDDRWCYARRNGVLLYNGDNHLSVDGSRLAAQRLAGILFP